MTIFFFRVSSAARASAQSFIFDVNSLSLPLGEMDNANAALQLQQNAIGE
jgi:hypothetical protein